MTLTEFLLARIAEDEAVARGVRAEQLEIEPYLSRESFGPDDESYPSAVEVNGEPAVSISTGRVLAECEAKRRIVGLVIDLDLHDGYTEAVRDACGLLALPYADHPDYQQEWKP